MNFYLKHVFLVVGSGMAINTGSCRTGDNFALNFDSENAIGKFLIFFKSLSKI